MTYEQMLGALEAVLFASGTPISVAEIAVVMGLEKPQIWDLLSKLQHNYETEERGLMLREVEGAYQLVTKPLYYDLLKNLGQKKEIKLTSAAMETLAMVAFKQPITKAEMEAIRGVKMDSVINTLVELDLIVESGRKKAIGSPILYATTDKFLNVFGLASLSDLPAFANFLPDSIGIQQSLALDEDKL